MGNIPSVEAPRKGSRAPQKLSKPRTGNPATAGLSNSGSVADLIRHSSTSAAARRQSLPNGSTAPPPSPRTIDSHAPTMEASLAGRKDSILERRLSRSLLRPDAHSNTSQHLRSRSASVSAKQRGRRMSRTNSVVSGGPEGSQTQPATPALSRNASRTSVNYDFSSYEAKRLLNLQETTFEDQSIGSESQFEVGVSRRQSYTRSPQPPPIPNSTAPLPRAHSDVSLYTPMRRRSFMTPGVATRPAAAETAKITKQRPRQSLPPTPSGRESMESIGVEMFTKASLGSDPNPIPRALTPCEGEYKQIGAFKLGTLRITNGSPARTPARDAHGDGRTSKDMPASRPKSSYFDMVAPRSDESHGASREPLQGSVPSHADASLLKVPGQDVHSKEGPQLIPELNMSISPIGAIEAATRSSLEISSKNTAMEDQLFEDGPAEYSGELLEVRVDSSAKSQNPRPITDIAVGAEKKRAVIDRSDSGIVTSPASDAPPNSLSKADSGYSSNVSLRSFASHKPREGNTAAKSSDLASPKSATHKRSESINHPTASRQATLPPELTIRVPSTDGGRPQVPVKDSPYKQTHTTPDPPAVTPRSPISARLRTRGKSLSAAVSKSSPLSPSNPSSSPSTLSIGNAPRKKGKLQRLLSSTRAPLTVHATHPFEKEIDVPPVPKAVQEKLREHTGLSPVCYHETTPNVRNDQQEQHTAMEDVTQTEITASLTTTRQKNSEGAVVHRSNLTIQSLSSTISRAASSVLAKNPMRMPTYHRSKSLNRHSEVKQVIDSVIYNSECVVQNGMGIEKAANSTSTATRKAGEEFYSRGRTESVSIRAKAMPSSPRMDRPSKVGSPAVEDEGQTSAFLRVQYTSHRPVSKTQPPVAMRTRSNGSLQASQPPRARSTPPEMSRQPSSGNIRSTRPSDQMKNAEGALLSRRASQDSLYNRKPGVMTRGPLVSASSSSSRPGVKSSRSMSFQLSAGQYRTPDWSNQLENGKAPSRKSSFEQNRVFTTQHRNASLTALQTPHRPSSNLPPPLKHRSSYDEYSFVVAQQGYGRDNGPYPAIARPKSRQSGTPTPDQRNRRPPRVPREHSRNRSLEQTGPKPPYRILHSYNSPAYKNVPIWS